MKCGETKKIQIERDIYITNVVRQVVERHLLRHIAEILPTNLNEDDMKKLVKNDTIEEAQKAEIKRKMGVLEASLKVLDGIQSGS